MTKSHVIDGVEYIPTGVAAKLVGYTTDYVGQLARGGFLPALHIGRRWFISRDAIVDHKHKKYGEKLHNPTHGAQEQEEKQLKEISEQAAYQTPKTEETLKVFSQSEQPTLAHASGVLPPMHEVGTMVPSEYSGRVSHREREKATRQQALLNEVDIRFLWGSEPDDRPLIPEIKKAVQARIDAAPIFKEMEEDARQEREAQEEVQVLKESSAQALAMPPTRALAYSPLRVLSTFVSLVLLGLVLAGAFSSVLLEQVVVASRQDTQANRAWRMTDDPAGRLSAMVGEYLQIP